MADVEYMHICDYAFPAEGGKACIIGIFSDLGAGTFPASHPYMAVAVQLQGQAHEVIPVRIELDGPDGTAISSVENTVAAGADGRAFLVLNMVGTQFPEPGRYGVKVSSGGRVLAAQSLRVHRLHAPEQAPPGERRH